MSSNKYLLSQPGAVLRVTGEDAPGYLQSQFSNDISREASEQPAVYGLWLDRKGKVKADSFILREGEENFILMSYHCNADILRTCVEENIIADDVEVEDITAQAQLLSCWGSAASAFLERGGRSAGGFVYMGDLFIFQGRRSLAPSAEILSLNGEIAFELVLSGTAWESVSTEQAERERIYGAIPRVTQDIGPKDLPQEGGLERDAVSFRKGCYLGQEVMARLEAMGRVNRGLYKVQFAGKLPPLPATVKAGEKSVGELRSATSDGEYNTGLALLKRRAVEEQSKLTLPDGSILSGL